MSVDITVALPTWDSKNIIWLQLESLCRQKTTYSWELVVCEEQFDDFAGEEFFRSYGERLKAAGCKQIIYIPLTTRTPVSKKWCIMANHGSGLSYVLAASDDYSGEYRLELSHTQIIDGYNWIDVAQCVFLNIKTFDMAMYDHNLKKTVANERTAIWMTTLRSYIKNIRCSVWPTSGVDNWMRSNIFTDKKQNRFRYNFSKPIGGVCTDGVNKISGVIAPMNGRTNRYSNKKYKVPFKHCDFHISDLLPEDIIYRLRNDFLVKQQHPTNNEIKNIGKNKTKPQVSKEISETKPQVSDNDMNNIPLPEPSPIMREKNLSSPDLKRIFPQQL